MLSCFGHSRCQISILEWIHLALAVDIFLVLKGCCILPFLLFCLTVFAESWIELPAPLMPRGNLKSWTCPSVLSTATSRTGGDKGERRRKKKKQFLKIKKQGELVNMCKQYAGRLPKIENKNLNYFKRVYILFLLKKYWQNNVTIFLLVLDEG